jgi:hypothetical protein
MEKRTATIVMRHLMELESGTREPAHQMKNDNRSKTPYQKCAEGSLVKLDPEHLYA